jgi:hypothetical protein
LLGDNTSVGSTNPGPGPKQPTWVAKTKLSRAVQAIPRALKRGRPYISRALPPFIYLFICSIASVLFILDSPLPVCPPTTIYRPAPIRSARLANQIISCVTGRPSHPEPERSVLKPPSIEFQVLALFLSEGKVTEHLHASHPPFPATHPFQSSLLRPSLL